MARILSEKALKLLPLLIVSVLVISVSAAVYNMMYMRSEPIAVEAAKVVFTTGTDSTAAGVTIGTNSTYVRLNGMKGWPNATRYYEDPVEIKNNDASTRTIKVTFESWSGDTSAVESILVKVFNSGSVQQGTTITVGTPSSSTGDITITAGSSYRVQWEIHWKATALSTNKVDITLSLRTNE
ncbi:MAG: hypothetical protein V1850_02060 [Candidatus Bathyarchaeota archaeon]